MAAHADRPHVFEILNIPVSCILFLLSSFLFRSVQFVGRGSVRGTSHLRPKEDAYLEYSLILVGMEMGTQSKHGTQHLTHTSVNADC